MPDVTKNFILFREDVESPNGVRTIQMSEDLLFICGKALQEECKLGEDPSWFWQEVTGVEKILNLDR